MDVLLLADAGSSDAGLYNILKDFVLPFLMGSVGTVVTLIVGYFTIRNTESYRRLAHWEPYSQQLWNRRFDFYFDAMPVISDCVDVLRDLSPDDRIDFEQELVKRSEELLRKTDRLWETSLVLCEGKVTRSFRLFTIISRMYFDEFRDRRQMNRTTEFAKVRESFNDLVTAIRNDSHLDELDQESRDRMNQIRSRRAKSPT